MNEFEVENKYLRPLEHRRFENINAIINALCIQENIFRANLTEEFEVEKICDNFLIGQLEFCNNRKFDIQLYYIKDNSNNYYITETIVLEEV